MYDYDTLVLDQVLVRDQEDDITYPDSDGQLMADNTLQLDCIMWLKGGLDVQYRHRSDVFVASNLLWYPEKGHPEICRAPDVMVVFGRPKGYRGSYKQWKEDDIAPQVVFEILSPCNNAREMAAKFDFYNTYGVEEYYVYDPEKGTLSGWQRIDGELLPIDPIGWVSPWLGLRFEMDGTELRLIRPDGKRLLTHIEQDEQRELAEQQRELAEQQRELAEQQREQERQQRELAEQQREQERQQREQERQQRELAEQQRELAEQQRELAEQQRLALIEKLREMGIDPDTFL